MTTKIVLMITGTLATVKKGLDQNLQLLPGHRSATGLHKVTLMRTAHSTCEVLGGIALISRWGMELPEDSHW